MRTRKSWKNQDRLWKALGNEQPKKVTISPETVEREFKELLLQRAREFKDRSLLEFRYATIQLYIELNYPDLKAAERNALADEIYERPKFNIVNTDHYISRS